MIKIRQINSVEPVNWLGDPENTFIAITFWDVWQSSPFCALILLASFTTVLSEIVAVTHLETTKLVAHFAPRPTPLPDSLDNYHFDFKNSRYSQTFWHGFHDDSPRSWVSYWICKFDDSANRVPWFRPRFWLKLRFYWSSPSCSVSCTSATFTKRSSNENPFSKEVEPCCLTKLLASNSLSLLHFSVLLDGDYESKGSDCCPTDSTSLGFRSYVWKLHRSLLHRWSLEEFA